MITEQLAVEIYKVKSRLSTTSYSGNNLVRTLTGESMRLAKTYGVTPRTIQNIWNRRSWGYVTKSLWSADELKLSLDLDTYAAVTQVRTHDGGFAIFCSA